MSPKLTFLLLLTYGFVQYGCTSTSGWWNYQYFYRLNVKSFKDSNGDGAGDLIGATQGLFHLKSLKVTTVILSPIFETVKDCEHYGISTFYDIDPQVGSIEDFENFIKKADKEGIRVILEFNLDETSEKSEWHQKYENDELNDLYSSSKEDEQKGNNKIITHPVLNYQGKTLYDELKNLMDFWLNKKIAGFLVPGNNLILNNSNIVEGFIILKNHLNNYSTQNSHSKRILMTEFHEDAREILRKYSEIIEKCFHTVFIDSFIYSLGDKFTAKDVKYVIDTTLTYADDLHIPTWILSNSLTGRLKTRVGQRYAEGLATVAALLPGNVVVNQGDEIGMSNVDIRPEDDINVCEQYLRDPTERAKLSSNTPFLWEDTPSAGFSTNSKTWLPIGDTGLNLAQQNIAGKSVYKMYVMLGNLRRVVRGDVEVKALPNGVLAYRRRSEGQGDVVVVQNLSPLVQTADLRAFKGLSDRGTVIWSTEQSTFSIDDEVAIDKVRLSSGEAVIFLVEEKSCDGFKPIDRIVAKLSEAKKKIGDYLTLLTN